MPKEIPPAKNLALHGNVLSFKGDPTLCGEKESYDFWENGCVAIGENGRILWRGNASDLPKQYSDYEKIQHGEKLITAGFIDAHLHFPQYRMIAAYGKDLLDWLNRYTFIEEQRYSDKKISEKAASAFTDELLRNGITACMPFSTIHNVAADALFERARSIGMALITGRTMMDRNAPKELCDTPQSAYDETKLLIEKWSGVSRLQVAITPRFAVTSSEAQLEMTGSLVKEFPALNMQTHISENHKEIETVAQQFKWSKDYTDVYDHYGLLGERSYFAHGIHLSERELSRLSESGSAIVHCPTSNNFLGSGHFRCHHTKQNSRPVKTGVGCDIGGGTSFSMLQTLRDAYTVSQMVGSRISPFEAFYLATLGNAKILHLDHEIGSLEPGKYADLVVLDPQATPIMAARHELSQDIKDVLFALMIMGDDRSITQTYVAGKPLKPLN